jgi:serine/threonine protein phosphatase PrpC
MKLLSAMLCKAGSKPVNEDAVGRAEPPKSDLGCWVLADGQGKRGGGDVGAERTVQAVLDTFNAHPTSSEGILYQALATAHQEILDLQAEIVRNQSIRVSAAVLCSSKKGVYWAHIGDARVHVFRNGELLCKTEDHTIAQTMVKAGELDASKLRSHKARHRLLRAIGTPGTVQPAVLRRHFELRSDDLFLLCSAGFWSHITELEMQADWCKSRDLDDWLERMELRLLKAAPADHDNYSAIALMAQD